MFDRLFLFKNKSTLCVQQVLRRIEPCLIRKFCDSNIKSADFRDCHIFSRAPRWPTYPIHKLYILSSPVAPKSIPMNAFSSQLPTFMCFIRFAQFQVGFVTVDEFVRNGYVMAIIIFISAMLQGSFSQASTHIINVEGIRMKTALQVSS